MKYLKRFLSGLSLAMVGFVLFATVVLAVPGDVVFAIPNPTDTTMTLTWTIASGAVRTVIKYSTATYPATPADGILAYNGTGWQTTVTGLTAGTTYYFSAWGYDGGGVSSVNAAHTVMNTLAVALPDGGVGTPSAPIPVPFVPSSANATANITGFQLEPFTSMIRYFVTDNATSPGGLGMPENNAWETLAIGAIVVGGIGTYTKLKNFFIAYFVVLVFTTFFIALSLVQWWLAPIEMVIGLGIWALERYFQ